MGQKPAYSNTSEKYRPSELTLGKDFVAPANMYNFGPASPVKKPQNENILVKKTRNVGGGEIRLDTVDISEALKNEPTRKVARRIIDEVSKFTAIDEDHQAPSTKGKLIKMYEALYPGRFAAANQESYTRVEQETDSHTQESGSIDLSVDKRITAAKMAKNFIASRISKTQEQKRAVVDTPTVEIKTEQVEQKRGGVLRPGKKVSHESRSVDSTLTQPLVEKTMPVEPEEVEKSIPVAPEEVASTVSVPLNSEEAIETTTLTKPDTEAVQQSSEEPTKPIETEALSSTDQTNNIEVESDIETETIQEQNKKGILKEKVRGVGQSSPFFKHFSSELNTEDKDVISQQEITLEADNHNLNKASLNMSDLQTESPTTNTVEDNTSVNQTLKREESIELSPSLKADLEKKRAEVQRLLATMERNRRDVWKRNTESDHGEWASLAVATLTNLNYRGVNTLPKQIELISVPLKSWKDTDLSEDASNLLRDLQTV